MASIAFFVRFLKIRLRPVAPVRTGCRRAAGLLGAALLMPGVAVGQPLDEVVRVSLRSYPSIEVARSNRLGAFYSIEQARAGHYPVVDMVGQRRIAGNASNLAQPRMRLNLYASGSVEYGVERESWREQALAATELTTREDVAFGATHAWFRLLKAARVQAALDRNLERHQKLADDFAAIAAIDTGRRYDFVQARSRLEQVRQSVVQGQSEIATARAALARYFPGPIDPASLPWPRELRDPIEAELEDAVLRHPAMEAARRQVLSAESNVRAAKAARGPRVDIEATAGHDRASIVMFTWPAFDLGKGAAESAAVSGLTSARASVQEQELLVRERRETANQAWRSASQREAVATGQIAASNELVEVYRAQFQIGRRNLLDLLNAFAELFNAESAMEQSRVDKSLARYQMEYAVGRLAVVFEGGQR